MEPCFREAAESDIDAMIPCIRELYAQDHIEFDETIARAGLMGLIDDGSKGKAWVIRDGGRTVGYAVLGYGYSLEFHGRYAFLDELFVSEGHRGRGIGSKAVRFLLDECRKAGIRAIRLEVDGSNEKARDLYRKLGFIDHDRRLMTKWLPRAGC
jgi:ribosomal protein S18 acetylase RimI-like enzyme